MQSLLHIAPHVTTVFEVDMSAVLAHRQNNRDEFSRRGAPLTLTAYFLQASVDAIRAVPEANSRWTDGALEVYESIHIGVGTALEQGGLVVPVLRDVQARDLFATAAGLHDLVTRAREGRLTPADVRGGTFTISNHGVSGSLVATPIIINHYNIQPTYDIYADVDQRDLGGVASGIRKVMNRTADSLPQGTTLALRGEVEAAIRVELAAGAAQRTARP